MGSLESLPKDQKIKRLYAVTPPGYPTVSVKWEPRETVLVRLGQAYRKMMEREHRKRGEVGRRELD